MQSTDPIRTVPRKPLSGIAGLLAVGMLLVAASMRVLGQQPVLSGQPIVAIEFVCAAPIDRQGLLQILSFRVGDPLRAADLDRARQRLMQTNIFTEVRVDAEPRDNGAAVVAHLVRKEIVNAVRFRGNDALSDDELGRVARLRPGMVLTPEVHEFALSRLRERYVAEGFEAPRIGSEVRAGRAGEVDVTFQIDEGPPLIISAIAIEGSVPVGDDEVRATLGVKAGDRYVRAKQRTAQMAVLRLLRSKQYYEAEVGSRWERGEGQQGLLRFTVEAGPPFVVVFSGNHSFSDKKLLALMDLPTRPIVTDGTWRELARRARRAYQEAGYYQARVDLRIDPGPPKAVRFEVTEGESYRIAAVAFEGNQSLPASVLLAQMATRPPSWIPWRRGIFLDDVFDEDLKRLWFLYRQHGFEAAEIVDARTRFDPERGKLFVTVFIEEGRQTVVREIVRTGTEVIADNLPDFEVVVNEPLNPEQVEADRRALFSALAQAGYSGAEVTTEVRVTPDGATDAATVVFHAVPGGQQRVGTIIVQDNLETRSRVILRELPFKPGDPLNPDALLQGQSDLYRLGLFRSVTVRPLEAGAGEATRDIAVTVSEKPAGTLQWGAGYNTRDGFRGFTEVGYNNLQGLARRLSLRGEVTFDPQDAGPNQYLGNLGFREPRLGTTLWTFRTNLLAQRSTRSIDQFSLERFALVPAIERTLLPGLQAGLEFQAEQSQVFDVKPDVLAFNPRDAGRLRTFSLGPFAVYDGRDDAFLPHRGVFESMRFKLAPGELGSDVPFVKVLGHHSHYVPLVDDLTFVYAARGGWAHAYEGGDQVPIRERFFLGGRTTVRGFSENSIGPAGSQGNPLGGDWVLNLNTELQFPLIFGLAGGVFVDGGGVYLQDRALSIHDFRRSAGLGLRYLTPVGPISLEYGFKLDRRAGESLGEVHFSIGTIF